MENLAHIGAIYNALCYLHSKHLKVIDDLDVFSKPKRKVLTLKEFDVGKLILVPSTMHIAQKKPGTESHVTAELKTARGQELLFALSSASTIPDGTKGFVDPFWVILPGDNEENANLCLKSVDVKVSVGCVSTYTVGIPTLTNASKTDAGTSGAWRKPLASGACKKCRK